MSRIISESWLAKWSELVGERERVSYEDCYSTVLVSCCCFELVAEARGQFGNPEKEERPPL
jgi:hypothetical protein